MHDMFHEDYNGVPGPLLCYKVWACHEAHTKMRKLIVKSAEHYHNIYVKRHQDEGPGADFDVCELQGKIIMEGRKSALEHATQKKKEKAITKKQEQLEKARAEQCIGLFSPGRGVSSPSGVELGAHDVEELESLGQLTGSYMGECFMFLLL